MTDLSAFPITKRWAAQHPDRLQLYSLPTPNGVKVSIMLEEIGLPYEAHLVDFGKGDQRTSEYLSLNPYGKVPAIIDPAGPGGKPLPLFELGDPSLPCGEDRKTHARRSRGALRDARMAVLPNGGHRPDVRPGRLFSQIRRREIEDKRPLHRYRDEAKRILAVIEARLAERTWIMGDDYTIADISMLGWVRNLIGFYDAGELVGFAELKHVPGWLERGLARPAVQRGLDIPPRG